MPAHRAQASLFCCRQLSAFGVGRVLALDASSKRRPGLAVAAGCTAGEVLVLRT